MDLSSSQLRLLRKSRRGISAKNLSPKERETLAFLRDKGLIAVHPLDSLPYKISQEGLAALSGISKTEARARRAEVIAFISLLLSIVSFLLPFFC